MGKKIRKVKYVIPFIFGIVSVESSQSLQPSQKVQDRRDSSQVVLDNHDNLKDFYDKLPKWMPTDVEDTGIVDTSLDSTSLKVSDTSTSPSSVEKSKPSKKESSEQKYVEQTEERQVEQTEQAEKQVDKKEEQENKQENKKDQGDRGLIDDVRKLHVFKEEDILYFLRVIDPSFEDKRMTIPVSGKYWSSVSEVVDRIETFLESRRMSNVKVVGVAKTHPVIGYVIIENTSKPEPSRPAVIKSEIRSIERTKEVIEDKAPDLGKYLSFQLNELKSRLDSLETRVKTLERKEISNDLRMDYLESRFDSLSATVDSLSAYISTLPDEYELAGMMATEVINREREHQKKLKMKYANSSPVRKIRFSVLGTTERGISFEFETGGIVSLIVGGSTDYRDVSLLTSEYVVGVGIATPRVQFDVATVTVVHEKDSVNYKPILGDNKIKYSLTLKDIRLRTRVDISLDKRYRWWIEPEVTYYYPIFSPLQPIKAETSAGSVGLTIFYRGIGVTGGAKVVNFSEPEVTPFAGFSIDF